MKKILVIGITSILLFSAMLVGASCILNLPDYQIQANIKETYGSGLFISYLDIELSGIIGDFDVDNIYYPGHCIDYNTPLPWQPGSNPPQTGFINVKLYSSMCPPTGLDDPDWDKVNYILTHKNDYSPYTWSDVHQAINYFVNYGNPVPLTSTWAINMVNQANANPGFIPGPGDIIAVIVVVNDIIGSGRYQYTIIEVEVPIPPEEYCYSYHTGWAIGQYYNPFKIKNWAMYIPYNGETVITGVQYGRKNAVIAGATVKIEQAIDPNYVTITITLPDDWYFGIYDGTTTLSEVNIHIQDYATKPSGNPAPGLFQYHFIAEGHSFTTSIIPDNNFYGIHMELTHEFECTLYNQVMARFTFFQRFVERFPNAFPLLQLLLK